MLRLKPSELTLTPEDVDETLRRMARRQPPRPPAASGQRRTRMMGRPLAPRVMLGARRSTRDAITDLGNIPVLRPQPQQAIVANIDESEDSEETLAEPTGRIESSSDLVTEPTQPTQLAPTAPTAVASSLRHSTRLPFRLGLPRRRPETDQDASLSPKEQSDDSEGTLVETVGPPMETTNVCDPATPGRRRANDDVAPDSSPTRQSGPSATPAGLRGGASHPRRNRIQSIGQDALHAPSPLRQTLIPSPIHQSEESSSESDEEHPVIHLQGYFDFKSNPNVEYTYTFREIFPDAPRTEPFRRTSQPRFHARSHSSNDVPASRLFTPISNAQSTSTGDDVFWTAATPATAEPRNDGRRQGRPRLHSSEMSNTSLAYSYYELPEHRQSSGELSAQDPLSHSQFDGTAASRQASRGTYRSVRLSEAQALDDHVQRPPTPNTSNFSQLNPAFANQWSASPLPAEPYTRTSYIRTGTVGTHPQAAFRCDTQDDLDRVTHPSAIAAAVENRISPLDVLTAQYEWASQRLADQQGQPQRDFHSGSQSSAYYSARPGSGTYGPPMAMADDPYTRGATAHAGRLRVAPHTGRPFSVQPVPVTNHTITPSSRSAQVTRSSQRSSENAPVSVPIQSGRGARNTQVQDQVQAFEQMHSAAQSR